MKNILLILCLCFTTIFAESGIAQTNNIETWYETFGKKEDPALLLINGGCSQGILWPARFCNQLAEKGFYVIRYDLRDSGFSTCFDFKKNPYDLLDMAKDGLGLLDDLHIDQAHLFGFSMGGPIAELMSVHFPDRIKTVVLISTSSDFRPMMRAYTGLAPEERSLPSPTPSYLSFMKEFIGKAPQTEEEKLEQQLQGFRLLNGSVIAFDEQENREIQKEFLSRLRHPECVTNHLLAIDRSHQLIQTVSQQVRVPVLILHGTEDVIVPDHGKALAAAIPHAKYILVERMGHTINRHFENLIIEEFVQLTLR